MKSAATGTVSGFIVWIIACGLISSCLGPAAMMIGGFTSFSDFAIRQTGAIICPENTNPEIYSFATYGSGPSTTYVLQCIDASGEVVMEDPVGYAFLWIGIIVAIALLLSAALAFVFAAPVGVLITRFMNRRRSQS